MKPRHFEVVIFEGLDNRIYYVIWSLKEHSLDRQGELLRTTDKAVYLAFVTATAK